MNMIQERLLNLLRTRERKKLCPNTYLRRLKIAGESNTEKLTDALALQFHQTDIIKVSENGAIIVKTGGFKTVTTKARLNCFLAPFSIVLAPFSIVQRKGEWFWSIRNKKQFIEIPFTDGDAIGENGRLYPQAPVPQEIPKIIKCADKTRREVLSYAKRCAEAIPLPLPSNNRETFFCYDGENHVSPAIVLEAVKHDKYFYDLAFNSSMILNEQIRILIKNVIAIHLFRKLGMVPDSEKGKYSLPMGYSAN